MIVHLTIYSHQLKRFIGSGTVRGEGYPHFYVRYNSELYNLEQTIKNIISSYIISVPTLPAQEVVVCHNTKMGCANSERTILSILQGIYHKTVHNIKKDNLALCSCVSIIEV